MTATFTSGDIVLRNGVAEEIKRVCGDGSILFRRYGTSNRPGWCWASDATPLGINTRDGWKPHNGSARPEGVGAEDQVEVCWKDAERSAHGFQYIVGWDNGSIVAYRIVHRACPPAPDRDADVRAVAAELRAWWPGHNNKADISYAQLRAMADRLDPKPEPLRVGDRVRNAVDDGTILAIDGGAAWVKWDTQGRCTQLVERLERIA